MRRLATRLRNASFAAGTAIVLLSASGKRFDQETARRFAELQRIILICGRYEGVDERVAEHLATEEISIGDFVLSGGELPAMLIVDAVTRLLPGSLGNEASSQNESFSASIDGQEIAEGATSGRSSRYIPPPSEIQGGAPNARRGLHAVGFSALHAAGGISRMESAGCADRRKSCGGCTRGGATQPSKRPRKTGPT